jgi:glutamate-1-semialdehyde 2,1-aminomutase
MTMNNKVKLSQSRSAEFFAEAQKYIPGGVNSPVRAFKAVGGTPIYIQRGDGAYLWDVDGNQYVDMLSSWGPLILGHRHPRVVEALRQVIEIGTSFGAPTELETRLASLVTEALPSVEMVRMVSSGTEATMSALRLARGYTGRDKILKFEGCYHGHGDSLLIKAGSGLLSLGVPTSLGVPAVVAGATLVAPYNDLKAVEELFAAVGSEIAAVIVEPVAGNMGVVPPWPGFLEGLRDLTSKHGALLIFDEVITGFRLNYGGAQVELGIEPDLTCLGKIIGGGLPVGAYGGKREIMEFMAPLGPVYQAGTLSGNPLAMAAGVATLEVLREPEIYQELENKAAYLCHGLAEAAAAAGLVVRVVEMVKTKEEPAKSRNYQTLNLSDHLPAFGDMAKLEQGASGGRGGVCLTRVGSMLCLFFVNQAVLNYGSAAVADTDRYARYFWSMLQEGVYLAPAQFEAMFVSLAHSYQDLDLVIEASGRALVESIF